ncbi:hypothetical protein DWV69_03235 [Clostridium sp. AF12-19]|nr:MULTISPECIES: hypothetical protein [unclassified Clostridium]RHS26228.1 hypothetical protein DWV71_01325 [Clostridium sp. AF12-28]RHS29707.1 hypothetical protein DWV69_03235 [Clostridium sp. AF12-19]
MADTEKNEDQKISRCLQEAFGYTDEQLLKQLDQANETLKDVTFDGAEDRIMKKIMARKAELEKETSAPEPETERNITLVKAEPEERKDKKIVRFGKKKVLATVALVAVIAGMLGGTAVGKKNYFFRRINNSEPILRVDNDKNKNQSSELQNAYQVIEQHLNMPILKLGYCPRNLVFEDFNIYYDEALIEFKYGENIISFLQTKKGKSASTHYESDGVIADKVYNEWLNEEIRYTSNKLDDGNKEYEVLITVEDNLYYISGIIPENELRKILESLNFY